MSPLSCPCPSQQSPPTGAVQSDGAYTSLALGTPAQAPVVPAPGPYAGVTLPTGAPSGLAGALAAGDSGPESSAAINRYLASIGATGLPAQQAPAQPVYGMRPVNPYQSSPGPAGPRRHFGGPETPA